MKKEEFRRINFFKGFFTRAEDWQKAQDYHLEKRKFHHRFLHTPGVVFGCLDNLKVTAARGGTRLNIAPGYAIDGEGRDLYLPKQETVPIVPQNYDPPATVYVIIQYNEKEVDPRQNVDNPEYFGHAFLEEKPEVKITPDKPDNHHTLELARIELSKDATRVRDPVDPHRPGRNEIDLRCVKRAGVMIGPITLANIGKLVYKGNPEIAVSTDPIPSEDDPNVLIEQVRGKDAHRFYLVSVYPSKAARILWRIESSFKRNAVEYRLFFKNFSRMAVKVACKVYRLS